METERDKELYIGDYLNGLLTPEQEKEFVEWVHSSAENTVLFADYCARWELSAIHGTTRHSREEVNWRKLAFRIDPLLKTRFIWQRYGRLAAIFILAFLLGVAVMEIPAGKDTHHGLASWIIHETPYGSRSTVTLPDGSKVWMNAGSKIRYSGSFENTERLVFLEGEAYFEVATDTRHPFDVRASGINIRATGTIFNVRAYKEENFVETTLVEGRVMVKGSRQNHNETVQMKPGQHLTIFLGSETVPGKSTQEQPGDLSAGSGNQTVSGETTLNSNVETAVYTSWKDDEWIIQKEKFASLMVKLQRRYDVDFVIIDKKIENYSYSGKLKDETLEQVMKAIGQTSPISYNINGKKVEVWYNENFSKGFSK